MRQRLVGIIEQIEMAKLDGKTLSLRFTDMVTVIGTIVFHQFVRLKRKINKIRGIHRMLNPAFGRMLLLRLKPDIDILHAQFSPNRPSLFEQGIARCAGGVSKPAIRPKRRSGEVISKEKVLHADQSEPSVDVVRGLREHSIDREPISLVDKRKPGVQPDKPGSIRQRFWQKNRFISWQSADLGSHRAVLIFNVSSR